MLINFSYSSIFSYPNSLWLTNSKISSKPQDIEDLIKDINNLEIGKSKKSIAIPKIYTFEQTKINKKLMDSRRCFSGISRTILETRETSNNNDRLLKQADKNGTGIVESIDPKIEYENF